MLNELDDLLMRNSVAAMSDSQLLDEIKSASEKIDTAEGRNFLWQLIEQWESRAELRNKVKMILQK